MIANPWIVLAGAAAISALSFFGGFVAATDQYQENLIAAQDARAVAQKKYDDEQAEHARTASQLVAARKQTRVQVIERVRTEIVELPMVVDGTCSFTPDVLRLLNEAAR